MIYAFIGISLGIGFICILPKLMEWTDWSSKDWEKKIDEFRQKLKHIKIEI